MDLSYNQLPNKVLVLYPKFIRTLNEQHRSGPRHPQRAVAVDPVETGEPDGGGGRGSMGGWSLLRSESNLSTEFCFSTPIE